MFGRLLGMLGRQPDMNRATFIQKGFRHRSHRLGQFRIIGVDNDQAGVTRQQTREPLPGDLLTQHRAGENDSLVFRQVRYHNVI